MVYRYHVGVKATRVEEFCITGGDKPDPVAFLQIEKGASGHFVLATGNSGSGCFQCMMFK